MVKGLTQKIPRGYEWFEGVFLLWSTFVPRSHSSNRLGNGSSYILRRPLRPLIIHTHTHTHIYTFHHYLLLLLTPPLHRLGKCFQPPVSESWLVEGGYIPTRDRLSTLSVSIHAMRKPAAFFVLPSLRRCGCRCWRFLVSFDSKIHGCWTA